MSTVFKRLLYPGFINTPEIILVSGSVYGYEISQLCQSLKYGCESEGYTVSICVQGSSREHVVADQYGSPDDWDMNYDVILIDMGEYLSGVDFRHGRIDLDYTRLLFLSPVAETKLANRHPLQSEIDDQIDVLNYLSSHLIDKESIVLVKPSMIRLTSSERLIAETNSEILLALENGEQPSQELLNKRKLWKSTRVVDQVPALRRPLW